LKDYTSGTNNVYVIFQPEECPTNPDDLFASILKMEEDPHLDFNLIGKDLETIASSSSDSGLSSALSLSYEQQLSPFLSKTDNNEEEEIGNSDLSSRQDFMDFEAAASPSLGSVDSPVRSVMSSNIGSPITDMAEEMDYEQSLVAIVTPNNTISSLSTTIATEQPIVDIGKTLSHSRKSTCNNMIKKVREMSLNNVSLFCSQIICLRHVIDLTCTCY